MKPCFDCINNKMKAKKMISGGITHIFTYLLLFLYSTSLITAHQEVENEAEFEYDEKSEKGPKMWGDLKKEWEACKATGVDHIQSPIDICTQNVETVPNSGEIIKTYKPADAEFRNRGHDISLHWTGDPGLIKVDGQDYVLVQCHWHSPSEHSIDGHRYDLERHMVHKDKNEKIVVVSQLFKIGKPDRLLSMFSKEINSLADTHDSKKVGKIDPNDIEMAGRNYYRYMGSLTTPPCTEGVTWIINQELLTVSLDQIKLLRNAVHDFAEENARPVQPSNNRKIQLYLPPVSS